MNLPGGDKEAELRRRIKDLEERNAELETALLESEENFRNLTDSAPVGIYLDDAQGKATYINRKCAELVGVPAEDALNLDWIPYLHPDDRERMVAEWEKAFGNSEEFHLEYRWVHPDGKVVWTLGEVIPILGDDGKATMFIGTLTDITARKQAEVEKEQLEAQLIQAQKMESIGRLAGGVAHDYNNMLGVIIGYTELAVAEVEPTDPVLEKLQEILKAAKSSAEVTRQLLSFARKQIALPKVFDVNEAMKSMLNMLRRLIGEEISLDWAPQAGRMSVSMDPTQFDQLVVNLCINARDAIGGVGKITIETSTVAFDEAYCSEQRELVPGEFVMLSISDDGSGMDEAILENIFEPFFTTKGTNSSTGLGLASVYGTVKQNDGFILVESQPGVGATFKVHLPLHKSRTSEVEAPEPQTIQKGAGETILVVEDEKTILNLVELILSSSGYKVLAANNKTEALEMARGTDGQIDLLLTDVIMPGMNGRDLADLLRSTQPNMKCLYMSGYTADVIAKQTALERNFNFIQKPFSIEHLTRKVRETLS